MANKKNNKRNSGGKAPKDSALLPAAEGVSSSGSAEEATPASTATSATPTPKEGMYMAVFKQRKTDKSGSTSYSMDGVRSSVYFNKGIFAGNPPAEIEITSDVPFTQPGAAKVSAPKLSAEEKKAAADKLKAERAAMTPAQKRAAKLEETRKALARLEAAAAKDAEEAAAAGGDATE